MTKNIYSQITEDIKGLARLCSENSAIDPVLYTKYDVKRGLRDISGKGVLVGLTEIGDVQAYIEKDGKTEPCEGRLLYQGIDLSKIVEGFVNDDRFGFEEIAFLLLFGQLPDKAELDKFTSILSGYRTLPTNFVRDVIMKAPACDMMNTLSRSVLTLYAYDDKADDTSIPNVLRQCLQLIALFPMLSVYGYQAFKHYHDDQSLVIHRPEPTLSTAENLLHILRADSKYSKLEAKILDLALVLHAEHGGGNNSTFTTRVVTSSGTDTYSAIAAALGSLKGPKHGGANIKVVKMFDDIKAKISDWSDEEEISVYLAKILNKEEFDKSGLIYGMGHAVYSLSDPRATILKSFVEKLSVEKGREDEFKLYSLVEKLASEIISKERKIYKGVSANIDFYSGFIYSMLDLPLELYTPIFAVSRIVGWSAHRIEELSNAGKIIRPAYKNVREERPYIDIENR